MKRVSVLVALASLVALDASAGDCGKTSLGMSFNEPVRFADRHDLRDVDYGISTTNRKVDLLLTDRAVALQLSDRVLRKLDRKQREFDDGDTHALGRIIKTAVLSSVRTVLSHSAECDYRDIASVDYRHGEVIIKGWDGERIFAEHDRDDDHVMRQFSEEDARDFVRELRRKLARERE